ncbi:MAG: DUF1501 domain-containing protein [bacterium]
MSMKRRDFLKAGALVSVMPGLKIGFAQAASKGVSGDPDVIVQVFLRGAMDTLNLLPPINGANRSNYEGLRPNLQIPIASILPINGVSDFGLHPAATGLQTLFNTSKLALIQACGLPVANRSHFDAQAFMDLGTPGQKNTADGWLTRHFEHSPNLLPGAQVPAFSAGWYTSVSFLNDPEALTLAEPGNFDLNAGSWQWEDQQKAALSDYFGGATSIDQAGTQALNAVNIVQSQDFNAGPVYPNGELGNFLKTISVMIKADVGVQMAAVDYGGWDTHQGQGVVDPADYFYTHVQHLSDSLKVFYDDMAASGWGGKVTVVVNTEFGRRAYENQDAGTDHGYAFAMMVLGDNVNGGMYGTFPGLAQNELFEQDDLNATTDFRQVLSEVLIRRTGNNKLGFVFPGYTNYSPIGVVQGVDIPPDYNLAETIFANDFE